MREEYEWCNIWWNRAQDASLPRVLLIGDSISVGYTDTVIKLLADRANVDRLGTSKCVIDPAFLAETAYVLGQYPYAVIHFNNGLHGTHLTACQYEEGLKRYLISLQELAGTATLICATSTPLASADNTNDIDPERNGQVIARNAAVEKVAAELSIEVNDLYSLAIARPDLRALDGCHFLPDGYEVLGAAVVKAIEARLDRRS